MYTLENKFAVYPRIILDNKNKKFSADVLETLERQGYISKDEDDFYYVQFFDTFGKDNDDTILRANIKSWLIQLVDIETSLIRAKYRKEKN